ncbi:MAG TPA: MBOAT family O-acyltransferase [Anaerolineales bacterium]|nr:MBOAT family O-acyltransferase [Anaerolineales bacterium]
MSISQLFIIAAIAFLVGQLKWGRSLALLGVSAFFIYWLQPPQEQVTLTFWLPTFTLFVTILAWLLTSTPEVRGWKQSLPALTVIMGVMILMDLNRYLGFGSIFTVETPRLQWMVAALIFLLALILALSRVRKFSPVLLVLAALGLIILFVLIKVPRLLSLLFETLSTLRGKDAIGFNALSWLGFSYVAFRLLHTIFDRKAGRLPAVPLGDYVNYVIFFPSFTAGPIDRLERFNRDLNEPVELDRAGWVEAGTRFFVGLFKKFVIADALAWIALNDVFVEQVHSSAWMWVLLYSYSLRIYFDFSGYTDIAIGIARLLGVRLPENFASPYLKPNLSQFWNSWHMTLTQWFRSYFFNPLTRALRSSQQPFPTFLTILIAQISTMVLIGMWHGVTTGFVLWGLWHGAGLFIQNRWSDYMKDHTPAWGRTPTGQAMLRFSGVFLTFHFVSLGWLFFSLSTPAKVWAVMAILFGVT